ncbi:thioesterase domain-containing protein, partial [Dietzia cercidiphylli]|uniref:thioesterase domain-containing protein n=1 Tax=Dietzia cercidiphylli TaxID=498199 RepID=UPI003F7D3C7F
DRAALPVPELMREEFVAPSSAAEEAVAEVFAEVLGVERVGAGDNFFDLGGNSLNAMQVAARVGERLSVVVGIRAVFENPTVAGLADCVTAQDARFELRGSLGTGDASAMAVTVPLAVPVPGRPTLFCIHPATGIGWGYWPLTKALPGVGMYAMQHPGLSDSGLANLSVSDLAERYVLEIQATQPSGPYRILGWSLGGHLAHAVTSRLEALGEVVDLLVMLDSRHSSDIVDESSESEEEWAADIFELIANAIPNGIRLRSDPSVIKLVENAYRVLLAAPTLVENDAPNRVSASILYFTAAHEISERAPHLPWVPLTAGSLENVNAPFTHSELGELNGMEFVGRWLREQVALTEH